MVAAMVSDMVLVDKETVVGVVAENENLEKTEIHETEIEIEIVTEMVTEIELVLSVIVKEQKKMLVEAVMRQSYPMRMMSN